MDWIAALTINGIAARQVIARRMETPAMSVIGHGTPFIIAVATPTTRVVPAVKRPPKPSFPTIADPKLYQL